MEKGESSTETLILPEAMIDHIQSYMNRYEFDRHSFKVMVQRMLNPVYENSVALDVKMKKGKTIEEFTLPEAMIHHIQSFMSATEAARTAILSKPWYNAWLTRPTIDLDVEDFRDVQELRYSSNRFEKFAKKTVQRYRDSNLKIEKLRVRGGLDHRWIENLAAAAMKLGATDVELKFPYIISSSVLSLPREVLGSETPVRLSIYWCRLEGKHLIRCSRLKSLVLEHVVFDDDQHLFKDITKSCVGLEELSLSDCWGLEMSRVNLEQLHRLRRLYLCCMIIDASFFSDFDSRFPCLKDLSINYSPCKSIHLASTSLQTLTYKPSCDAYRAEFCVPNIRNFTCSSLGLPSRISVNGASHEWEFDLFISTSSAPGKTWFSNLKRILENQFNRSRIASLSVRLDECRQTSFPEADEAGPKPLVVENLRITNTRYRWSCALLVPLFGSFQPKTITHCLHRKGYKRPKCKKHYYEKEVLQMLCRKLVQQVTGAGGVPEQDMFGKFGLKRVNVEAMDKFGKEWRPVALEKPLDAATIPVVNKRKVRFHLIWD